MSRTTPLLNALGSFCMSVGAHRSFAGRIGDMLAPVSRADPWPLPIFLDEESKGGITDEMEAVAAKLAEAIKSRKSDEERIRVDLAVSPVVAVVVEKALHRVLFDVDASHAELAMRGVLIGGVTAFEVLLSAIARDVYVRAPRLLSEKKIDAGMLWSATVEDLKEQVIAAEVDALLRDSAAGWLDFIKKRAHLDMDMCPVSWKSFSAVVQHRHIIVHADNRVTQRFLQHHPSPDEVAGLKPGEPLPISEEYLLGSLDVIESLGVWITLQRSLKLDKEAVNARNVLRQIARNHIERKWWPTAAAFCRWLHEAGGSARDRSIAQLDHWLCTKKQGRWADVEGAVAELDVPDAAAEICIRKLALLGNYDAAYRQVENAPPAKALYVLLSPYFDDEHNNEEYRRRVQELHRAAGRVAAKSQLRQ